MASYTVAFKEEAVHKVLLSDSHTSIIDIAKKIGVSIPTLRQWVHRHHEVTLLNSQLSESQRTEAVLSTLNLSAQEKSTYCRRKGLLPEELESWELEMKKNLLTPMIEESEHLKIKKERDSLKKQLEAQGKELRYKDKALAEAAALLVLQKKVRRLWVDEEESMTNESDTNSSP